MADLAEKLIYARKRMNLKGHQVESETGIGPSSLSDFEKGKRMPSLSQLASLARVYNRSTTFFMDDSPIPQETVLWRKRPTDNAEDIETRFLRLCEQYSRLEVWCDDRVPDRLPKPARKIDSYDGAELLADQVRQDLHLGKQPGGELLRELQYFEYELTESGNVRMNAASGQHDDLVIALALAAYQSRTAAFAGSYLSRNGRVAAKGW